MENIKKLWSRVLAKNKNEIIEILSKESGLSESSVRTNWFSSWKIPDVRMTRVHELIINTLKSQGEKTEKIIND